MSHPINSLKYRKGSIAYSARSRLSRESSGYQHFHLSDIIHATEDEEDDLQDIDIENDVLYPQYLNTEDNHSIRDLRIFDDELAAQESKVTTGSVISRTYSRHNKLYGENKKWSEDVSPAHGIYDIYSTHKDIQPIQIKQLLTTEGKQALETMLETNGWWLDVLSPTDDEMNVLCKLFRIHSLTVEDILANEPNEKIELFPNYTFVCIRSFEMDHDANQIWPYNFYNLIFKDGLISFHFRYSPHPARVRHRLDQLKHYIPIVSDWVNYALIDDITDAFAPIINEIEIESVTIDELSLVLNKTERSDMLKRISRCRKRTSQLLRLLGMKIDVVKSLLKRYEEKWNRAGGYNTLMMDEDSNISLEEITDQKALNEVLLYIGDVQDHLVTMMQNVQHYSRILSRAHTNYLAQVNVDLSMTYRTTNAVMNRLTFLGTMFIPIIFLCGLFGMNVKVPGGDDLDNSFFFWIVIVMILYTVITTYFGKRFQLL
ncbi:unnamed protein product [Cunninghamella echinulata]